MLCRLPFRALSTGCEILIRGKNVETAKALVKISLKELTRLEKKYNFFDPNSYLSSLNRKAYRNSFALDEETTSLFEYIKNVHEQSEGAFDPTIGTIKKLWDFDQMSLPDPEILQQLIPTMGWSQVQYSQTSIQTIYPQTKIDLGGVVKEYAVDRCQAILESVGVEDGLINFGGDLRVVGKKSPKMWNVGIANPRLNNHTLGTILLQNGAIASSGDNQRYFLRDGIRYHHLLSTKTGYPAQLDFSQVTVHALTAMEASQWASCILLGGYQFLKKTSKKPPGFLVCDREGKVIMRQENKLFRIQLEND